MTRIRKNGLPDRRYGEKGQRPDTWLTGPDPWLHQVHKKYLKARVQARHWQQQWLMTFEQYATKYREAGADPFEDARRPWSINLCRINKAGAWSVENTVMRTRAEQMSRAKTLDEQGQVRRRQRRNSQGPVKPFNKNHIG